MQPESHLTPLILDFLEWTAREPRPYREVMDVWRTSCPRLTVWEDCMDRGLVVRRYMPEAGAFIEPTREGWLLLQEGGRMRLPPDCAMRDSASH